MRLLKFDDRGELGLTRDLQDNIPPYAILSHTWGNDEDEVTFDDLKNKSGRSKKGFEKIRFCGEQANKDGLEHFWVDTCCIDKASQAELSEAIASMFRWYRDADKCYVYLPDVSVCEVADNEIKRTLKLDFRNSRWFTRGWTLQELIAPVSVEFFSQERERLGSKSTLEEQIHEITDIPITALRGAPLSQFSVDERMRWAAKRDTKKKEDQAYCLLGIFEVFLPLIYGEGENAFVRLKEEINKHSRATLDEIDLAVRNHYLRDGCLTIERLSGKTLPMGRCFINLGIVDHVRDGDRKRLHDADAGRHLSEFSLAARLKVETPPENKQVTLQTLFSPRERPDGTTARPNRILIWGRAGIGKTTLCKKIVHDFIHNGLWSDLFDRVYWLPLRRLKLMSNVLINVGQLIQIEHLPDAREPQHLAEVLQKALTSHGNRTLFVLDGLDEVTYAWDPDHPMGRILNQLLKQVNTIVTSRPHSTYGLDHAPPNLELETIGFFPAQVEEYLEWVQTGPLEKTVLEIRSFIRSNPLVQGLARIPVQLDAICYAWSAKRFPKGNVTMTVLYQAITQRLWEKDIIRLEKKVGGERITRQQVQDSCNSKDFVKGEIHFLEELAFGCLYNEIVEFDTEHIGQVGTGQEPILGDHPVHMSFLRSSDSSISPTDRTYHFIHLTFQEFFAAQYFVRQWASGATITLWKMDLQGLKTSKNTEQITPVAFLRREKYSARYDIFWRFVTGLLHDEEDLQHLHRFFDMAEGEPRDLLGPTHQRLIIHCLSEIGKSRENFQSRVQHLEDSYWSWILFESKINSSTALVREAECPHRILTPWLEGSNEEKIKAMSALKDRPAISSEILKKVMSELDKPTNKDIFSAAFQVLGNHCGQITGEKFSDFISKQDVNIRLTAVKGLAQSRILGASAVEALVRLLQDRDLDMRSSAAGALGRQTILPGSAVEALVRLLQDGDPDVRSSAARALDRQTTLPGSAVEALVRLLQDGDPGVRSSAADALGRQTTLPDSAVEALVRLLQDGHPDLRSSAARALDRQTTLPGSAVEALVRLLQDGHPDLRSSAARALDRQTTLPGSAVEALARLLQDGDPGVRSSAADALGRQTTLPGSAVEALVRLLQDGYSGLRWSATRALGGQTTLPGSAVEALVRLLQDRYPYVRSSAARALGGQTTLLGSAVEALVRLLQDGHPYVRSSAADALGRQTTLPGSAVEALVRLMQDGHPGVRSSAADALGRQTTLPGSAVEALVRLLQDGHSGMRSSAARALGRQTTLLGSAVEALVRLLQDGDPGVRWSATRALGGQTTLPGSAVEALVRLLQDGDPYVRWSAADALGGQTTLPGSAVEALVRLLQDGHPGVRSNAARALDRQTTLLGSAVEALVRLLQDGHSGVRSSAARALGGQTTLPGSAVEALVRLLQDGHPGVRSSAARALGGQTTLPGSAVEALVRLLQDGHPGVRSSAADALGRQTTLPDSAVEALVRLLQDGHPDLRSSAARALDRQTTLPGSAVEALVRLLQDGDPDLRSSAARALDRQTTLPGSAVEALVRLLQDRYPDVRSSAARVLGQQTTLPGSAVEKLISLLQVEISSSNAAVVLEKCENFYSSILRLGPSSLQTLLTFWLKRSFLNSVTCYIWNGILSIDINGQLRSIPLEKGQHKAFENAYFTAQEAIGSPQHCTRQIGKRKRKDTKLHGLERRKR